MTDKTTIRPVPKGEYGNVYTGERGTCYICGLNQDASKLIKLTARENFLLELYCIATNANPPKGLIYFCHDRKDCDKWVAKRSLAVRVAPVTAPEPVKFHPNPAVTSAKRSRNKYG